MILFRLSDSLNFTNRECVRVLKILKGFHGPDQPHQRTPATRLLMGAKAPSQLDPGTSVPARTTSQELWLAAQPQPSPRLVTDAADPGLDLQIDFLAWLHTCLFPTNLPDGLNSCLVLSPSSWFALLGYGGMQLVVLHSAPGSLSLSKQPALTDRSQREPKHLPFGNQKSLSHTFLSILNTKYANWS